MAATILNSTQAIEVSVYVVRAFVQMREWAATHQDLAKRLDVLEKKAEKLAMQHDAFSRNTPCPVAAGIRSIAAIDRAARSTTTTDWFYRAVGREYKARKVPCLDANDDFFNA